MKPIATSTSDFADLITSGGIYVDKTGYFHRLVSNRLNKLLFLARPRRFGKSLMITALKEIFMGRRELFEGSAISKTDWKWEKWPVIHFNFGDASSASIEDFKATVTPRTKSLYAAMAYGPTEGRVHENSYARCLSFLLAGSGFKFTMEDVQANGHADIVASHVNGVFIFELKVGESVDKAFKQIRDKGYATPYLASGWPIHLIGLSFDPETRHLVDAVAEPY